MKATNKDVLQGRFRFWVFGAILIIATPLLAGSTFDAQIFGIKNTDLPTEGNNTYGPENNRESSLRKIAAAREQTRKDIATQFCDQAPSDQLCATLPNDNTDFSEFFVYLFINDAAQNSFDIFSWQSFVGLNWPQGSDGLPLEARIGKAPILARVWARYKTPREIFAKHRKDDICSEFTSLDEPYLETDSFLQSSLKPLIDKNLNYVVYDVRINDVLAEYIEQNNLTTFQGQQAFLASAAEIDFPVGYYQDPVTRSGGQPGSVAVKTAWKILDFESGDDPARYYTVNGLISVSAQNSASGQSFCLRERLGLVGMHIMTRTDSGNGRNWTWSTFGHIDNAPLATNARRPNDILHKAPFADGCQGPDNSTQNYAFFDTNCPDCVTNHIDPADWKWSANKPYAKTSSMHQGYGTQVVRCWKIFEGTQLINEIWQEKLKHTVWGNYQLLSAQWKGGNRGLMFPEGEVPRFLTNPTLETYEQYNYNSSCLGCHATAVSLAGQNAKFSFLLSMPSRFSQP